MARLPRTTDYGTRRRAQGVRGASVTAEPGEGRGAGLPDLRSLMPVMARGSTADAVTECLREAVLSGTIPPWTWLREQELAQALAVSRTPVRDALRRLSDDGLTLRVVNRGTVVAPMSVEDILAVYSVRESLEGLAARTVALRRPPGLVAALTAVQRQMREAADDVAACASLNRDFHRLLREGSENPYLDRFLTQVEQAVRRFGRSTFEQPGRIEQTLKEHGAILAAIAAGDAEAAERHAVEHMSRARQVRVDQILGR